MQIELPEPAKVWQAIEIYLKHAYAGAAPPNAVQARLKTLRESVGDFYLSPAFELDKKDSPTRWSLRLGNKEYPHMKLSIGPRPDGRGYLFHADTHDKHISVPPGSKEHAMFARLIEQNQSMAQAIESSWAEHGLPTFKSFLRDDLARRQADAQHGGQTQ